MNNRTKFSNRSFLKAFSTRKEPERATVAATAAELLFMLPLNSMTGQKSLKINDGIREKINLKNLQIRQISTNSIDS